MPLFTNSRFTRIRIWCLKKLLTQDEKYMMMRAIEDRIDDLQRISVNERWADKESIQKDCMDYFVLMTVFATKDYK